MIEPWGLVREIDPDEESTWRSRVFLTIDVDWAPDFVLEDCRNFLQQFGVPTTWFITHESDYFSDFSSASVEMGIHPNFTTLLSNPSQESDSAKIIKNARLLVPEATSFRNHSLVQSSPLLNQFRDCGYTHDCNLFLPAVPVESLAPWRHWNGLIRVPHCWEDDIWLLSGCRDLCEVLRFRHGGMVVIDIHPIHVYLNTSRIEDYENAKPFMRDQERLSAMRKRSPKRGVRDVLIEAAEKFS